MDPISRFLGWAQFKLSDHRMVDGLLLYGRAEELDRVVEALSLIKLHDPIRYAQICRDLNYIQTAVLSGALGQYVAQTRTCKLERRYVLSKETTIALIASVIVHEATHARLDAIGVAYEEDRRSRIEEVCFRREIAFGKRLPLGGDEVVGRAQRTLEAAYDFSDSALLERRLAGGQEALRHLGAPDWLIRFVTKTGGSFRRWKLARRKARGKR